MVSKAQRKQKTPEKKPPKDSDLIKSAIEDRGGHCMKCPLKQRFVVKRPSTLFGGFLSHKNVVVRVECEASPNTEKKPFQGTDGVRPEENYTLCTSFRRFMAKNK